MNNPITLEWDEPWRETETFLRLLRGPRFAAPPTDEHGIAIGGYCTTINREPFLRDHPKMRVDLSDPDDRENVARRIWRDGRPAYVGVLLCRIDQATEWRRRRDNGKAFPVGFYRRTNAHVEHRQALWCDIEGSDLDEQIQRLRDFAVHPTMVVWSGHLSLHAYWILERPVTGRAFRRLMPALCAQLRGNRRAISPMQQMRLPGGVHERTGARASLVLAGERYYRAGQVARAITVSDGEVEAYFGQPRPAARSGRAAAAPARGVMSA